jgi:single-strand DNA-binding protein
MAGFNKMIAMGNLTKDPVLRTIPSGAQVCDMALATNRTFMLGGEKREETCFIDVAVWGKQGEACGKFLTKGQPVLIEGRLVLQWEKDGEKRSKHIITAERVQFLGAPKGAPAEVETPAASEAEAPF